MDYEIIADRDYSGHDLSGESFYRQRFENCSFSDAVLKGTDFEDCIFFECSLVNPDVTNTKFTGVLFDSSKIMGLRFYMCSQLALDVSFQKCRIVSCNFSEVKLKGVEFTDCDLKESYFQDSSLPEAKFDGCKFTDVLFHNADLREASFRRAEGYMINPNSNNIKGACFSVPDVLNLLGGFGIKIEN